MTRLMILFASALYACGGASPQPAINDGTPQPGPDVAEPAAKPPELCKDIAAFDLDAHMSELDAAESTGEGSQELDEMKREGLAYQLDENMPPYVEAAANYGPHTVAIVSTCDDATETCTFSMITATDDWYGHEEMGSEPPPMFTIHKTVNMDDIGAPSGDMVAVEMQMTTNTTTPDVALWVTLGEGMEHLVLYSYPDLDMLWSQELFSGGTGGGCDTMLDGWVDVTCDGTTEALVSVMCDQDETWYRHAFALDPASGQFVEIGKALVPDDGM
jgi:hypothetical protein